MKHALLLALGTIGLQFTCTCHILLDNDTLHFSSDTTDSVERSTTHVRSYSSFSGFIYDGIWGRHAWPVIGWRTK